MKKYRIEIIAFLCGLVVMIFEITGARVLAPLLGTSAVVWSSIIGVILAGLSAGYWFGGKLADKKADFKQLSMIILISAILIALVGIVHTHVVSFFARGIQNIKISASIISLILFATPAFLLGIVSPYCTRLKLSKINTSGTVIGSIYSISTLGSIIGTFLAGFVLIPLLGTTYVIITCAVLLVISALLSYIGFRGIVTSLLITMLCIGSSIKSFSRSKSIIRVESEYNSIQIYDATHPTNKRATKFMQINNELSSAMYLDTDELVYDYSQYYKLGEHFFPNYKKALMIGGAAYSFPKFFLNYYPDKQIDVVEIDPELTELAKRYFRLQDNERLRIFHQDGRVFINNCTEQYDLVFSDAYKSNFIPPHLTTKQTAQGIYDILSAEGVVIQNVISGINSTFLKRIYKTYKSVFPQVFFFKVENMENIAMVALKSTRPTTFSDPNSELNHYLSLLIKDIPETDLPIITDDNMPTFYDIYE